ncbi:hypothetical protein BBJ28_00011119 [Nothophytophthora sp. Chile5]|nr:hypothetical protein BBJ28_00011119 [Nothophytophthora sp. Chile5]
MGLSQEQIVLVLHKFPRVFCLSEEGMWKNVHYMEQRGVDPEGIVKIIHHVPEFLARKTSSVHAQLEMLDELFGPGAGIQAMTNHPRILMSNSGELRRAFNFLVEVVGFSPERLGSNIGLIMRNVDNILKPRAEFLRTEGLTKMAPKPTGLPLETSPLLAKGGDEQQQSKEKVAAFSRWRDDDVDGDNDDDDDDDVDTDSSGTTKHKKKKRMAQRQMLCLQFSLILLFVWDLASLLVVCGLSLGGAAFAEFAWLVEVQRVQWRFWGLPVWATLAKCVLFLAATRWPDARSATWLAHAFCLGFLTLLAVDAFRLDAISRQDEEKQALVDANVANSLPLIFTVLEVVNLNYLLDSTRTPPPPESQALPQVVAETPQDPAKPRGISFVKLVYILKPYFWPHGFTNKTRAASTYVVLILSKLANLVAPLYMASATNALVAQDASTAILDIAIFCGLSLASKLFKEMQSLIYLKVKQTAYIELATLTYEHVQSLSYDWHVAKKLGDVLRSMDRGVESANSVVSYVFLYLFPTLAESVVVVVIFAVHFELAALSFVAFSSLVVYAYLTIKITLWRKKYREASMRHDNEYHDKATDALLNYETIKYFGNERYEIDSYAKVIEKYQRYSVSVQASLSVLNGVQAVVIQSTVFAALALAAPHVLSADSGRSIDIGAFVAISVYLTNLFAPLFFLGGIYNMVINSVVDMKKLSELLSVEPDVVDTPDATPLRLCQYDQENGIDVAFRHVYFHYPSQPSTSGVKDLSFTIPRGTTTALVGETGAGKTTISRLLFRFYECKAGKVLVNHHDLAKVTQHSLRQAIGIVPQDTVLFNDTILSNIKYGNLRATFEQVVEAAKNARVYDFIMALPDQWNTKVGERGLKLSGGEKQRVAIARTLLKDPPFVILDEATSALDTVTEQEIQAALNRLKANRTMLVIAHRLSTIRNAHQIIVMQHGSVAERGTHDELLAQPDSIYSSMWNAQRKHEGEGEAVEALGADVGAEAAAADIE